MVYRDHENEAKLRVPPIAQVLGDRDQAGVKLKLRNLAWLRLNGTLDQRENAWLENRGVGVGAMNAEHAALFFREADVGNRGRDAAKADLCSAGRVGKVFAKELGREHVFAGTPLPGKRFRHVWPFESG